MRKLLLGLAVLPFLAGVSLAGQPQALTDQQMDKIAAGFDFFEIDTNNVGATATLVNIEPLGSNLCTSTGCFVQIQGTTYPSGVQSFQLYAAFGPVCHRSCAGIRMIG
ncbi:MAG TPA: hypothetical protein VLX09_04490 [Stellaceae bacterium]|nr:hypothetical protein [Stellaceae bacterium]